MHKGLHQPRIAARLTRIIREQGRPVVLLTDQQSGDEFNPQHITSEQPAHALEIELQRTDDAGRLVQHSDIALLLDSEHSPDTTMRLRDGQDVYAISRVQSIRRGRDVLLYRVEASR